MDYGLIGAKLGHSFSAEIHARIADYRYELCELTVEGVHELMQTRPFRAINVTIPYKETVIPLIDEISPHAARIGAVNTIVNRGGRLCGFNTDYAGAAALIRHAGVNVTGKIVLILGTGGTSKTMHAVVEDMSPAQILTVSRRPSPDTRIITYEQAAAEHTDAQIIINTTPVGMFPNTDASPIDLDKFPAAEGVIDVIYHPLSTCLVEAARKRNIPAEGGLYMLAAQAVYASALFLGTAQDENVPYDSLAPLIERTYRGVLEQKQNIVLIGMPSSGKSTVGARLAALTGRRLLDTDEITANLAGMPIPEIFRTQGETAFRATEARAVKQAADESGVIIATGGGAPLFPQNMDKLRQNGVIFLLDRSLEKLIATADRPLTSNREALAQKYRDRMPLYRALCDFSIPGDGSVEQVAREILDQFETWS